MASLASLKKSK